LRRIARVIEQAFGVHYHVNSLHRLLDGLGWSLQQPLPRATERDEALIRAWLTKDWPRIKKSAALRRGHCVL
jgi:transposase